MNTLKNILLLTLAPTLFLSLNASDKKDKIHMYPQAQEGYTRYVITVPKTENDYDHKLELFIGKTMLVDCNNRSFFGKVNEVTLKGWGYRYLEISNIEAGASTMMACPGPKVEKFVSLRAPEKLIRRYNSRLPLVVYVPSDYTLKYRFWSASEDVQDASQH